MDITPNETVTYKDHLVTIEYDECTSMPWDDMDGLPALIWYNDSVNDTYARDIKSPLDYIKDIDKKWHDIADILDINIATLKEEYKYSLEYYGLGSDYTKHDCLHEIFNERLNEDSSPSYWSYAQDYFQALEALWKLAGYQAKYFQVNGYRQGDAAIGLMLLDDEFFRVTGCDKLKEHNFVSDIHIFKCWAFGDTYAYTIEKQAPACDHCGEHGDNIHVGSCGGFYGLASAIEAVKEELNTNTKE